MLRRSFAGFLLTAIALTISLDAQVKTTTTQAPKRTVLAAVDINSATEDNMVTVLGIDKAAATKIVAGRPFRNKRDILSRQLVTADQYNKIKSHIVARQPLNKQPVRR